MEADDLWIKRDDLSSLGGGGNKIRKLEFTVAHALAGGADTLVTTGAPQSNHARLTAAAAARLDLDAVLVFPGQPQRGMPPRSGNIALDGLFGANIAWAGDVDHAGLDAAVEAVLRELTSRGRRPALIPFGGSNATGALGYALAAQEIRAQLPPVQQVVVALGSGGTMAGLVHEFGVDHVYGVHTGAIDEPARAVHAILQEMAGRSEPSDRLRIRTDQVGDGYPTLTSRVAEAMEIAARTEGLVLDPIYTGRALAGLMAAVTDGHIRPGTPTVFVHTGGMPGLFGHPDAVARAEGAVQDFAFDRGANHLHV